MKLGPQKGGGFEREICAHLSLCLTNGQKDDVLWRSAMSGGKATLAERRGRNAAAQSGDICATAPEGYDLTELFFLECKFYKNLQIVPFVLQEEKGNLAKFWHDTVIAAHKHRKYPILFAKQNRLPVLVLKFASDPQPAGSAKAEPVLARFRPRRIDIYRLTDLFPRPPRRKRAAK